MIAGIVQVVIDLQVGSDLIGFRHPVSGAPMEGLLVGLSDGGAYYKVRVSGEGDLLVNPCDAYLLSGPSTRVVRSAWHVRVLGALRKRTA